MTQNYPSRVPSRIINPFVFCRQPSTRRRTALF